ncbi:serine/threonine-protein kinase [Aporhodopirellula aestuarii]|uniref:Serine/threonine protein kinase n=1 Tax=Aporhodopirellula aestuarii TaxID=2950107 RepID=A0ABT0U494_9BACT|nr:serine/threonine-protein kinase [Aporhodopirellula aestuarii]MCM2371746.1 serine/threonine protein kinase [Aporhodopirellula aestuarii]
MNDPCEDDESLPTSDPEQTDLGSGRDCGVGGPVERPQVASGSVADAGHRDRGDDGEDDADCDETVLTPRFDAEQLAGNDSAGDAGLKGQFAVGNASANITSQQIPAELFPGALPAGCQVDEFRIISPLGQGAFACVYLAQQVSMRRLVALKISTGSDREGGDAEESQTLARLDHPGIVRVFDQRFLEGHDAHLLYMQYLPGGTLAGVVARVRQFRRAAVVAASSGQPVAELTGQVLLDSVDEQLLRASQQVPEHSPTREWIASASWPMVVSWIGVQLGHALQAAHDQGVFHRDVKPANVLLSAEGLPRLADFNVSFSVPTTSSVCTDGESNPSADVSSEVSRSIGGSLAYMAPEQIRAVCEAVCALSSHSASQRDVGELADVYSTGVLLWELWQGQRPFEDEPGPMRGRGWFERHAERRRGSPIRAEVPPSQRTGRTSLARRSFVEGSTAGSQRVLEQVLRQAIEFEQDKRPQSAAELSARLRLALYPDAARLFDPAANSWAGRCCRLSPWLIAAAFILLPNIAAGCFNFLYNYVEIIGRHPELKPRFFALANTVNLIAFPLGGLLMVTSAKPVATAILQARAGGSSDQDAISKTVHLGRRAAWIGGLLWLVAAFVYPLVLVTGSPSLSPVEAVHFFGSLLICGGVAAVYPFFGLVVMTSTVYYPCLVRKTMQDPRFDDRYADIRRWCGRFLLAAAGIPLLGLALLLSRDTMAKYVVASAVAATAIGLVAAFAAYQCVQTNWETMSEVLSSRKRSVGAAGFDRPYK